MVRDQHHIGLCLYLRTAKGWRMSERSRTVYSSPGSMISAFWGPLLMQHSPSVSTVLSEGRDSQLGSCRQKLRIMYLCSLRSKIKSAQRMTHKCQCDRRFQIHDPTPYTTWPKENLTDNIQLWKRKKKKEKKYGNLEVTEIKLMLYCGRMSYNCGCKNIKKVKFLIHLICELGSGCVIALLFWKKKYLFQRFVFCSLYHLLCQAQDVGLLLPRIRWIISCANWTSNYDRGP